METKPIYFSQTLKYTKKFSTDSMVSYKKILYKHLKNTPFKWIPYNEDGRISAFEELAHCDSEHCTHYRCVCVCVFCFPKNSRI